MRHIKEEDDELDAKLFSSHRIKYESYYSDDKAKVKVKMESDDKDAEVVSIKEEPAAYTVNSSGRFKFVFKSSPMHVRSPVYVDLSSDDSLKLSATTPCQKSLRIKLERVDDPPPLKRPRMSSLTDDGEATPSCSMQNIKNDDSLMCADDDQALLHDDSKCRTSPIELAQSFAEDVGNMVTAADSSCSGMDLSEDDAAVAGLLSITGGEMDLSEYPIDECVPTSDFVSDNIPTYHQSCDDDAVAESLQTNCPQNFSVTTEVDDDINISLTDVSTLMADLNRFDDVADTSPVVGDEDESLDDCVVIENDKDVIDGVMVETTAIEYLVPPMDLIRSVSFDSVNSLQQEMQCAINSILSLQQQDGSISFISSTSSSTAATAATVPFSTSDVIYGQDDENLDAAINSILM